MGVDYRAYAVIGLRIDKKDLIAGRVWVKTCDHDFEIDTLYHPKTGKKLWEQEDKLIEGYDFDGETLFDYALITSGSDSEQYIVSIVDTGGATYSNGGADIEGSDLDLKSVAAQKKDMQKLLEPLGLWIEEEFGLWAVLYCSY